MKPAAHAALMAAALWLGCHGFSCGQTQRADAPRTLAIDIRQCLFMALTNNLEIEVERLNPQFADASVRGASAKFEPAVDLSAEALDRDNPAEPWPGGARSSESEATRYTFGLGGEMPAGGRWGLDMSAANNESPASEYASRYNNSAGLSLSQPVARGFGTDIAMAEIRVARLDKRAADASLEFSVAGLIRDVYFAYYTLLQAQANLDSFSESLALAEQLESDNRGRVDAGAMSPLDITQARTEVVARESQVIASEQDLDDAGLALKRLIFRDLEARLDQRIVPARPPRPLTTAMPTFNVLNALERRADLRAARTHVERSGIRLRVAKNDLLPTIDVRGSFRLLGIDDGFGDSWDRAFRGSGREWGVGVVVTIPLGSGRERAARDQAALEQQRAILSVKALEQDIVAEVDRAARAVIANQRRYAAAAEATALVRETVAAELERLSAGTSTTYIVAQVQRDLTLARTSEIQAMADWARSLVELSRVEGTLLEANGIAVE